MLVVCGHFGQNTPTKIFATICNVYNLNRPRGISSVESAFYMIEDVGPSFEEVGHHRQPEVHRASARRPRRDPREAHCTCGTALAARQAEAEARAAREEAKAGANAAREEAKTGAHAARDAGSASRGPPRAEKR